MPAPRINPQSLDWLAVRENVNAELARLREELEAPGLSHENTERIRGRLAGLKWLLGLPQQQLEDIQGAAEGPVSY